MKSLVKRYLTPAIDILLVPLALPASLVLKLVRFIGLHRLPLCRRILVRIGVLPVRHHYYEPMVTEQDLIFPLTSARDLPGIDWNIPRQLELLAKLDFADEISSFVTPRSGALEFRLGNESFESGDAEFLYQMIRYLKPHLVIEIGSGQSTLIVHQALQKNAAEQSYRDPAEHICIEPFEAGWLESAGLATVVRRRVEQVEPAVFQRLQRNDLLFIDSSHVIRPQGDVLTEYLSILPRLRDGVVVHIHDVFSPFDYPKEWVLDKMQIWNEQYVLEAFLSENRNWEILAALGLLKHSHYDSLRRVCPFLKPERAPGSFYIQRVN